MTEISDKLKKKQDKREIFHYEEESNNASLKEKWNRNREESNSKYIT